MRKYGLKIAALLLSVVFVFAVFPSLRSNAATTKYELNGNTLTISGNGIITSNGLTNYLVSIFKDKNDVNRVEIGAEITGIADYAFSEYSNLESISIPAGVTSIGAYAFSHCYSLKSITIPDSVTSIGDYAFYFCSSLESISIPAGVTQISNNAFSDCFNLKSITIPNSVTSIGDYAFYCCSSLESISIPAGVTSIGNYALYGCESLKNLEIPSDVTEISDYTFSYCSSLESISIPAGVTSIGAGAFIGCSSLKNITIPADVTSIDAYAFSGCTNLESITIPDSVTSIGGCAFVGCSKLKNVIIPDSVTSIGKYAFSGCTNLTSVTMNATQYANLSDDVFDGCSKDLKFYVYYNVDYAEVDNGSVDGIDTTNGYGTDKLTIKPDEHYVVDEINLVDAEGNKTKIDPDASGNYYLPYLDPAITNRDVKIVASFKPVQVTITFENTDGTVLQTVSCDYGSIPKYTGETPTKPADDQCTYTFEGWTDGTKQYKPTDALPVVTADATYTAVYSSTTNEYTVKFIDDSGKELQSSSIKYDQVPSYAGDTPAKAEDEQYTYTFAGWTADGTKIYGPADELPPVTGNVIYNAVFIATEKVVPDPEVAPVKPVVDPDIKPVTTEVEVKKPGVYYLNSLTGDGVTTDVVATIKRTEDDVHCVEYFGNAEVDGTPMTVGEQILVGSGSTIITIKKEFLATIGEGTHTLKVTFTDGGTITIEFTVKAAANNGASVPATGESMSYYTIAGLMLAGAGVIVFGLGQKKKRTASK